MGKDTSSLIPNCTPMESRSFKSNIYSKNYLEKSTQKCIPTNIHIELQMSYRSFTIPETY